MVDPSEEKIIEVLARNLDNRKFPFQIPRAFVYGWECDFWCMSNTGETREFEIKISRSDYAIDHKKEKHLDVTKGANYFYYVCPSGLIAKEEVRGKYGLIYVNDRGMQIVKKPSKLHDRLFGDWRMLANKMYWKWYSLWWSKYKGKEISQDEWRAGFNISLESETDHTE
jgi:hypothetical protein